MWANRLIARANNPTNIQKQCAVLIASLLFSTMLSASPAPHLIVQLNNSKSNKTYSLKQHSGIARITSNTGIAIEPIRTASGNRHILRLGNNHSEADVEKILQQLNQLDDVVYAEIDTRFYPQFTPNDTDFGEQWYLFEAAGGINATTAWDTNRGVNSTVIAVLDTGILPHTELSGRTLPGYDFIADVDTANDGDGRDNDPADPGDWITSLESGSISGPFFGCTVSNSSWHGTVISTLLAANTENSQGMAGIDHLASILPVRVLGKCGGFSSDIADAIRWAAGISDPALPATNSNPAHIINLSLGSPFISACNNTIQSAIDDAFNAGAIIITAAGNNGGAATNYSPGNCNNVINVASSTRQGGRTGYTNFGNVIDISAPGGNGVASIDDIYAGSNDGATSPNNQSFTRVSGTSFAAPMVAGAAALARGANTQLSAAELSNIMRSSIRSFPVATTDGVADCTITTCGAGLLDTNSAVVAAANGGLGGSGNGSIRMTQANACVIENDGSITLQVSRLGGSGIVSATVISQDISAESTLDFTGINEILTWQDGDFGSKTVTVAVKTDSIIEASELFSVRINNISLGAQISEPASTTVTIISSNGNTPRTCSSTNVSSGAAATGTSGGGNIFGLLMLIAVSGVFIRRSTGFRIKNSK